MLKKSGIFALVLSAVLAIFGPAAAEAQQRYNAPQYNNRYYSQRDRRSFENERRDRRSYNDRREYRRENRWENERYYQRENPRNYFASPYVDQGYYYQVPRCDRY